MASTTVKTIDVALKATTTKFDTGLKSAKRSLSGFVRELDSVIPGLSSFGARLGVVAGKFAPFAALGGAIAGVTAAIRNAWRETDRLADAAANIGITATQLRVLESASARVGIASSVVERGITRLTVAAGNALVGLKAYQRAFSSLGISMEEVRASTPYELFKLVADRIAGLKNPTDQARVAYELFGLRGIELIRTLKAGSDVIREVENDVQRLGATVRSDVAGAVDYWKMSVDKLSLAWDGFSNNVAKTSLPIINALAWSLQKLATTIAFTAETLAGNPLGALQAAGWAELPKPIEDAGKAIQENVKRTLHFHFSTEKALSAAADALRRFKDESDAINASPPDDTAERLASYYDRMKGALADIESAVARVESPHDVLIRQMGELNMLYDRGFISLTKRNELMTRLTQKQAELVAKAQAERRARQMEFVKDYMTRAEDFARGHIERLRSMFAPTQGPAALERGSAEAFSAFQQNKKEQEYAAQMVAEQKKTNTWLQRQYQRAIVLAEASI